LLTEARTPRKIVNIVNKSGKCLVKQHEFVDGRVFYRQQKGIYRQQNTRTAAVNGSCTVVVRRDKAPALSARQGACRYEEQSGDEHRFLKGASLPKGQTVFVPLFRAGRSGDLPPHNQSSFSR
jgi:hypothetical protein